MDRVAPILIVMFLLMSPLAILVTESLHNDKIKVAGPPTSGTWDITTEEIIQDSTFVINGSIIIHTGGKLVLINSTIYINSTYPLEYYIEVQSGGNLTLVDSTITAYNTDYPYYLDIQNKAFFYMENSEISYAGYNDIGFRIETSNVTIKDSIIHHVYEPYFYYAENVTIKNTTFHDNEQGLYFRYSSNIYFFNNTIVDHTSPGAVGIFADACDNITIANNTIKNINYQGISIRNVDEIFIENNTVLDVSSDFGIYLTISSTPATVKNNKLYECPLYIKVQSTDLLANIDFSDNTLNDLPIQMYDKYDNQVIQDLNLGELIILFSTMLTLENVNVSAIELYNSNNITYKRGVISNSTIGVRIDGSEFITFDSITMNTKTCVVAYGTSYIDLKGIFINGTGGGTGFLMSYDDNIRISNSRFFNKYKHVDILYSQNITIESNIFNVSNTAINIRYSHTGILIDGNNFYSSDNNAIRIEQSSEVNINHNHFNDSYTAVYLYKSENVTVISNTMNNTIYGVSLSTSSGVTISSNDIYNTGYGISVYDTNASKLSYNEIIAGINDIKISNSRDLVISWNTLRLATYGVYVASTNYTVIANNTIRDNNLGVYFDDKSNHNTVLGNYFVNNTGGNAYDMGISNTFDWNYWDDYTGSDSDGDGIGDTPYDVSPANSDKRPLMYPWWSDNYGPAIRAIYWNPTTPNELEEVIVQVNVSDMNGLSSVIVSYYDGETWHNITMLFNATSGYWEATIPGLPAKIGNVVFKIYTKDHRDNWSVSAEHSYSLTDVYPPVIISVTPETGLPDPSQVVLISANVSDTGIISHVTLYYCPGDMWYSTNMTLNSSTNLWQAYIPGQKDGTTVDYYIVAVDEANHTTQSEIMSIYFDGSGPEFISVIWDPNTPKENESVLVKVKVEDPSGVNSVILYYNNGTDTFAVSMTYNNETGEWEAQIPGMKNDTHVTFYIKAVDGKGYESQSETYEYTVFEKAEREEEESFPLEMVLPIVGIAAVAGIGLVLIIVRSRKKEKKS